MTAAPKRSTFTRREQPVNKHDGAGSRALTGEIAEKLGKKTRKNPAGRPKGSKDKVPTELRQAVLDAGNLAGYDVVVRELVDEQMALLHEEDPEKAAQPWARRAVERAVRKVAHGELTDYLRHQAKHNPTAYLSVLGKVLPKQIDMTVQLTAREVLGEMTQRRDQLADMRMKVIEAAKGVDYVVED